MRIMSIRCAVSVMLLACACDRPDEPFAGECQLVTGGPGSNGNVALDVEVIAENLEVPWAIAFVPGTEDVLVTERPGRVRLIRAGELVDAPVASIAVANRDEAGLLGLALSPAF